MKNQKILKTCLACRNKVKKTNEIIPMMVPVPEPDPVPDPVPVPEPDPVPDPFPEPVPEPVPVQVPIPIKQWIEVSGHWIQPGDELKLHKKLLGKVNRQFQKKCAFPVHQYLSRWWMVDIRDHRMN